MSHSCRTQSIYLQCTVTSQLPGFSLKHLNLNSKQVNCLYYLQSFKSNQIFECPRSNIPDSVVLQVPILRKVRNL